MAMLRSELRIIPSLSSRGRYYIGREFWNHLDKMWIPEYKEPTTFYQTYERAERSLRILLVYSVENTEFENAVASYFFSMDGCNRATNAHVARALEGLQRTLDDCYDN